MATAEEIINLIKTSPLDEKEIGDIMATCVTVTFASAFLGLGLDLMNEDAQQVDEVLSGEREDLGELCGASKPAHTKGKVWMCVVDAHEDKPNDHRWRQVKEVKR